MCLTIYCLRARARCVLDELRSSVFDWTCLLRREADERVRSGGRETRSWEIESPSSRFRRIYRPAGTGIGVFPFPLADDKALPRTLAGFPAARQRRLRARNVSTSADVFGANRSRGSRAPFASRSDNPALLTGEESLFIQIRGGIQSIVPGAMPKVGVYTTVREA